MTSEEVLLEKIKVLSPDLKQEALHFVEFLTGKERDKSPHPRRSLRGIWADNPSGLTEKDLSEARNEMWRGYTKATENES